MKSTDNQVKARSIILTNLEKLGVKLGTITQVRMPINPSEYPRNGTNHPTLSLDSRVKIDDDLIIKVTGIRVEHIQDTSDHEALLCGVRKRTTQPNPVATLFSNSTPSWFQERWDEKYGEGAWDHNDWVWVIDFKVLEGA